ncbi:hypothetical protein GCM10009105_15180 [Dokdonella soli]|uniref:Uncharacterized protein n=1 Tax=Dokdonella soli TaxID=529810 RepID=A0ABP3TM95_9GAMM
MQQLDIREQRRDGGVRKFEMKGCETRAEALPQRIAVSHGGRNDTGRAVSARALRKSTDPSAFAPKYRRANGGPRLKPAR